MLYHIVHKTYYHQRRYYQAKEKEEPVVSLFLLQVILDYEQFA